MVPLGRVLGGWQATDTTGRRARVQSLPHSELCKSVFILKADDFTKNKAKLSVLETTLNSPTIMMATPRLGMKEGSSRKQQYQLQGPSVWVPAWPEREDTNEQGWNT